MRLHFVTIPVFESAAAEAELNRFLACQRVLAVDRQLVADGTRSAWAVCVSYVDRPSVASSPALLAGQGAGASGGASRGVVDYRQTLTPADFDVFARLRSLRKGIAERDGIPAYAIFTNEQLAAIACGRPRSAADLGRIPGVGKARVDKYGGAFLVEVVGPAASAGPSDPGDDKGATVDNEDAGDAA